MVDYVLPKGKGKLPGNLVDLTKIQLLEFTFALDCISENKTVLQERKDFEKYN